MLHALRIYALGLRTTNPLSSVIDVKKTISPVWIFIIEILLINLLPYLRCLATVTVRTGYWKRLQNAKSYAQIAIGKNIGMRWVSVGRAESWVRIPLGGLFRFCCDSGRVACAWPITVFMGVRIPPVVFYWGCCMGQILDLQFGKRGSLPRSSTLRLTRLLPEQGRGASEHRCRMTPATFLTPRDVVEEFDKKVCGSIPHSST